MFEQLIVSTDRNDPAPQPPSNPPFQFGLETAAADARIAAWMIREPSIISKSFEKIGGRDGAAQLSIGIANLVRAELRKTPRFKAFSPEISRLEKAVTSYVIEESIEKYYFQKPFLKKPESFWSDYESVRRDAHEIIGKVMNEVMGVHPYAIWDTGQIPIAMEPKPSLERYCCGQFRGWQKPEIFGDNFDSVIKNLLRPWLVIAEIADFYQRNRLQIATTFTRARSESFWGESNTSEIVHELTQFSMRKAKQDWGEVLSILASLHSGPPVALDGIGFEVECLQAIKNGGHHAEVTSGSGDKGVDIIAEINGMTVGLQCKNHNKPIGLKAVQEVFAGIRYYGIELGGVISPSGYTTAAHDLAKETGIRLLVKADLADLGALFRSSR